jgi:hypothetical protein
MFPIGDIISGILRGIGELIGALRKSRQAVQIMKLAASVGATSLAVYLGAIGLGLPKTEALQAAAVAAAGLLITSPLTQGLDVRLPLWLARAIKKRTQPVGWDVTGAVVMYSDGIFAPEGTRLTTVIPGTKPLPQWVEIVASGRGRFTLSSGQKPLAQYSVTTQRQTFRSQLPPRRSGESFELTIISDGEIYFHDIRDPLSVIPRLTPDENSLVQP